MEESATKKLKELTVDEKKEITDQDELNKKLFKTIRLKELDKCEKWLKAGADPNVCRDDGKVALDYARSQIHPLDEKYPKFVSLLRAHYAKGRPDYHFKLYSQLTFEEQLMLKVEDMCKEDSYKLYGGDPQKALRALDKLMYKSHPFNVAIDQKDIQLLQAVDQEEDEKVKALLVQGAHVNIQKERGGTPLRTAVFYDNLVLVKLLLDNGAHPNLGGADFLTTPLQAAAYGCFSESKKRNGVAIMKLLLDRGARMYITLGRWHLGCTPLSWVTDYNSPEIAERHLKILLTYVQREDAPWGIPTADVVNNLLERNKLLLCMGAQGTMRDYMFQSSKFEKVKELLDVKNIEQYREKITEHVKVIQAQRLHFLLVLKRLKPKLDKPLLPIIDGYLLGVGLSGDELPSPVEDE